VTYNRPQKKRVLRKRPTPRERDLERALFEERLAHMVQQDMVSALKKTIVGIGEVLQIANTRMMPGGKDGAR
jgi:hypothetical protein